MPIEIWYGICGLILTAVVAAVHYLESRMPFYKNRIFDCLIVISFVLNVLYMAEIAVFSGTVGTFGLDRIFLDHVIVGIGRVVMFAIPILYLFYVTDIVNVKFSSKQYLLGVVIPAVLSAALTIFVYASRSLSYWNKQNKIEFTPLGQALYLIAFLYFFFMMIYICLRFLPTSDRERKLELIFYVVIEIIGMIFYIFKAAGICNFNMAMSLLLCEYMLQKPNVYADSVKGIWNEKAFEITFSNFIHAEKKFEIIAMKIDDEKMSEDKYDDAFLENLCMDFGLILNKYISSPGLYRAQNNKIIALIYENEIPRVSQMLLDLESKLGSGMNNLASGSRLGVRFCSLECPKEAESAEEVFLKIDAAARYAMENNLTVCKTANIDDSLADRKQRIISIVSKAVENGLLEVYYQPIFDVKSGRFVSAEALVRLHDGENGFISPAEFIPIAERKGEIGGIDSFVLDEVCRMLEESDAISNGIKFIEVNISAVECIQSNLSERISAVMDKHSISHEFINFEITETAADNYSDNMNENIIKLASQAFKLSIDDFGTGYSNMLRIFSMPFDIFKLDKTLVTAAGENEKSRMILEKVVRMIRKRDYEIVAEGIEKEEEANMIIALGCDYIQGFYYAKPMPESEFLRFIGERNSYYNKTPKF